MGSENTSRYQEESFDLFTTLSAPQILPFFYIYSLSCRCWAKLLSPSQLYGAFPSPPSGPTTLRLTWLDATGFWLPPLLAQEAS